MDERTAAQPRVTERDREHMRRIGEYERQAAAAELREHLARPGGERLSQSWHMTRAYGKDVEPDDQGEIRAMRRFYDRATELGLRIR